MLTQKNTLLPPGEIVREALSKPSIFKNEEPLSLEWLPSRLPHRETQLRFLAELFRSVIDRPGTTSPKILVTGDIGTGKTVLTQRFGTDIIRTAKTLKLNLQYVHINCREFRGSLFMILKRVLQNFTPPIPPARILQRRTTTHTTRPIREQEPTHHPHTRRSRRTDQSRGIDQPLQSHKNTGGASRPTSQTITNRHNTRTTEPR